MQRAFRSFGPAKGTNKWSRLFVVVANNNCEAGTEWIRQSARVRLHTASQIGTHARYISPLSIHFRWVLFDMSISLKEIDSEEEEDDVVAPDECCLKGPSPRSLVCGVFRFLFIWELWLSQVHHYNTTHPGKRRKNIFIWYKTRLFVRKMLEFFKKKWLEMTYQ